MGGEELDYEELGRTIQLLYDAFQSVEAAAGRLSPFVSTHEALVEPVALLVSALASRLSGGGQPVAYEPGCGRGLVSSALGSMGCYTVCLEIDEDLAAEARRRRGVLVDVVVGDLASFRPRRVDAAYAYLLPRAVSLLLSALEGLGSAVVSLDFPREGGGGRRDPLLLSALEVGGRRLYVYRSWFKPRAGRRG